MNNIVSLRSMPAASNTAAEQPDLAWGNPRQLPDLLTQFISQFKAEQRRELKDDAMVDMTREEIDAKLATVEARSETRFVELSGKLDRVADAISRLGTSASDIRTEVKREASFTRWTIVGLVVAGLAALWVTQSNMLASFTAGIALHEAKPAAGGPPSAPKTQ
jgi:hypothetical protein